MIFVTGGTGLIGSHLLLDLARKGEKVRALKRPTSSLTVIKKVFEWYNASDLLQHIEWVDGNILDTDSLLDALINIEKVYHCAALVSFVPADKEELFKINKEGTANVVNTCLEMGIKKLCHVSSTAAIGKENPECNEESAWYADNRSYYSLSKYAAEQEVWRGMEEGLDAVIVNPCVVIGPGNINTSSSTIFKVVKKGLKFYPNGSNAFVDVRDVTRIMCQLMDSEIKGERYLLIGENLSFKDYFSTVAVALNKKPPHINATPIMTGLAWRVGGIVAKLTGQKPSITKDTVASSQTITRFSTTKIKAALPEIRFSSVKEAVDNAGKYYSSPLSKKI